MNSQKRLNITGERYGRLIALECLGTHEKKKICIWKCICDCGNFKNVQITELRRKNRGTKSCGCLFKESIKKTKNNLEYGLAAKRHCFRGYLSAAKRRNLIFNLTFEEFLNFTNKNCYYCNSFPKQTFKNQNHHGNYIYNGIDRINNNLGYEINNCITCCKICNFSKGKMTQEEFKNWIINIYKNFVAKN